jgi:hypothetical protein
MVNVAWDDLRDTEHMHCEVWRECLSPEAIGQELGIMLPRECIPH